MAYIVKKMTPEISPDVLAYIRDRLQYLNKLNSFKYDVDKMPLGYLINKHVVLVCFKNEQPVGFMIAMLNNSVFDITIKNLTQLVLYSDKPKATHMLVMEFIDFGKRNANYVAMSIGKFTNIKESSLVKLGFTKGDSEYLMEV